MIESVDPRLIAMTRVHDTGSRRACPQNLEILGFVGHTKLSPKLCAVVAAGGFERLVHLLIRIFQTLAALNLVGVSVSGNGRTMCGASLGMNGAPNVHMVLSLPVLHEKVCW